MRVGDIQYRTLWREGAVIHMIHQDRLPFYFEIHKAATYSETCQAIKQMIVRGAGAIGVAAAYAMAQAFYEAISENSIFYALDAKEEIESTRPTARELFYSTERVFEEGWKHMNNLTEACRAAFKMADRLAENNVRSARRIGEFGNSLILRGKRILTHCNAGWLAFVDHGSALAPVYQAHSEGKDIFVWVDETRPRSQGARLTSWELQQEGVSFSLVADNAGAYLMSKGMVDMVIVGADRIAANGDTANKIGTFEKAILAKEFDIPFYVAAPYSAIDNNCYDGSSIIIEEREDEELLYQEGINDDKVIQRIRIAPEGIKAFNPAFDITPVKYITAFITDRGIVRELKEE